jgi:hypothetical protein
MKKRILLLSFLLLSIMPPSVQAQSCSRGNTQFTAYMQRENDKRCEGVSPIDVSGAFSLISLSIGRIANLSNPLKLEVPSSNPPKVRVRSFAFAKNYQLDPIALRPKGLRHQFYWDNFVLRNANIPVNSLRAIAYVNAGRIVYVPVIFSPSAGKYDIVLSSDRRASITVLKIVQKGKVIYSTSRTEFQPKGQIPFTWNGRNNDGKLAPAGWYELHVNAKLEQDDSPPRPASVNITFSHNPQWLQ